MISSAMDEQQDERVLILAPAGRDAALLALALARAGVTAHVCLNAAEISRGVDEGAGMVLLTEESLDRAGVDEIRRGIGAQPAWSDIPVMALLSGRSPSEEREAVHSLDVLGNVSVLVRPVGTTVFVNSVRSALRARRRQYELRDYVQKLEESNRAKDEFVAMLAHELRNPLGAIRFAVEVLGSDKATEDSARRSRAVIDRQIGRLSRMLDDLLDASRVAQRKIQLKRGATDLVRCAEESIASIRPVFAERRVELSSALPRAHVVIDADPDRTVQIIDNLLTNAAKYTPAGGTAKLTVRQADTEAILEVEDDGIGLASQDLERIFEVFTQVAPPIDRSQGGLGLGLSIARGLAELHGGTLTAASAGLGKGTKFTLRLPIGAAIFEDTPQQRPPPRRSCRRVLLAEDNADARQTLRAMLELQGHTVRDAPDGIAALDVALDEMPQVGIIDIGLPGLDGYEVAKRLRRRFGGRLRLIALTGYGQAEARSTAAAAGFDAFLVKPVDPDELARALEP